VDGEQHPGQPGGRPKVEHVDANPDEEEVDPEHHQPGEQDQEHRVDQYGNA
jgi:hypothetical protein